MTPRSQRRREVGDSEALPCGMTPEQEHGREGEQHVPLERYGEREGREDEQVEGHHAHHSEQRDGQVRREQQDERQHDLDRRTAHVGKQRRGVRRAQVVGEAANVAALDALGHPRCVAHHRHDDTREVMAELRDAGAHPHRDDQQLEGDDEIDVGEDRKEDQRRDVLLAAGGQEHDLVPQTHDDEQTDEPEDGSSGSPTPRCPGRARRGTDGTRSARRARPPASRGSRRRARRRDRAAIASGERNPPRPRGQADRVGTGPVEDSRRSSA